ncbi:MAG TPA: ABC transporter permease subunit [Deltaproteobacteria bacterium]|nr:ABC transporter permease subunit [Deltaproteobacteria bacterium]
MFKKELFFWITISSGVVILAFILIPLVEMMTAPSMDMLVKTFNDKDVMRSIWLSIYTAGLAALISFIFGTPFAYLLARTDFTGKRLVESIIDLPIVIPHPVVGIAILSVAGKNHWIGQIMSELGIRIMGSVTGIVTVLVFVGLPFYVNAAKNGFESISPRLENVSRSLGASIFGTFFRVTFPLAWRSMLIGIIMCSARAISEFGAVVIVAYHPMIAPVMLYERFEGYGLRYSQPVAVWLVSI